MVVAFYFRLHLAYFPRPVVAIFARPEQKSDYSYPASGVTFVYLGNYMK